MPLNSADALTRSVGALVDRIFHGVDDLPQLRQGIRGALLDLARQAAAGGGLQLYLSLDTIAGVPLAAVLVVSMAAGSGGDVPPAVVAEDLARAFGHPTGPVPEVVDLGLGPALRRRTARSALAAEGLLPPDSAAEGDDPIMGRTLLEFVVPVPSSSCVLLLTFASPLEALADPLVDLFDAIAATARWVR